MKKNKFLYLNIFLSLGFFLLILYYNLTKSGGDIAIVLLNLLFGIIQILFVFIYGLIKKKVNGKALIVIVICQLVEFLIFINFGNKINRYYKINYLNHKVLMSEGNISDVLVVNNSTLHLQIIRNL